MIGAGGRAENRDFVGARVVDPLIGLDRVRTVVVRKGVIAALLDGPPAEPDPHVERVDCAGMLLCPGFIDPHVHLREPGDPRSETLLTGLAAAAAGGFTAVAAMPNTRPALDEPDRIRRLIADAQALGGTRCYPVGAVTTGRDGLTVAPLRSMAAAGAVAFSDDGASTKSLKALYRAALLVADLPQPFLSHCADESFGGAPMHEGELSDLLGMPGEPAVAEAAVVARDLLVAQATKKRWHVCHVSAEQTIGVLSWARSAAVDATAEVTPHHLHFTDDLLAGFDGNFRVNPPLRGASDVAALRRAVADRVITIFASDHAPHARAEKDLPVQGAAAGFTGLEIAVGAIFDALPDVPLETMIANFSTNVAALLGVRGGSLAVGAPADLTALYLDRPWTVDPSRFLSKGRVTPFAGRTFKVKPALTVVNGCVIMRDGAVCADAFVDALLKAAP